VSDPVLELTDVSKDYHGLRPLRMPPHRHPGEQVALLGFDQTTAELFVPVTGPRCRTADVRLFGRATADSAAATTG
jgi:hypothetical protein